MEVLEQFYASAFPIITKRLDEEIPGLYAYHSLRHTLDVIEQVESIGKSEGLTAHELMVTKIAALFHDTGFLISRKDHERSSCEIFRERAATFELNPKDMQLIEECIMSTKIPQHPIHTPSRVLCDADLDYLGRPDYESIAEQLFQELKGCGELQTREEWQRLQISFLSHHAYHTDYSRGCREKPKNETLERIRQIAP